MTDKVDTCFYPALCVVQDWQTLLAGVLALGAAWWTVHYIKQQVQLQQAQIDQTKERNAAAECRKSRAARAAMPDALSELCGYTVKCTKFLTNDVTGVELPERPAEATGVMKAAVEFVDETSAEALLKVLQQYQVLNARLEHCVQRPRSDFIVNERLYDVVHLHALVSRLFPFARNEDPTAPVTALPRAEMETALHICLGTIGHVDRARFGLLLENIERRHSV